MEKMTLLEMVQNILSAMNSDEVNSISDTVESMQVAEEIRTTYNDIFGNRDIATFESLINLESPGSTVTPHVLTVPSNVSFIKWLKYRDYRRNNLEFNTLQYLKPEDFISRIVEQPNNSGSYVNVALTSTSPIIFPIRSDKAPDFYTIFDDDQTLVMDSFDQTYETHLTGSNALAWGLLFKTFTLEDDFIPQIDVNLFPQLLAEAKSACFVNIKEVANSKEEQRARRQLVRSQTRLGRTADQMYDPYENFDFGRKR